MPSKPSVQDLRDLRTAIGHNIRAARVKRKMTLRKLSRLSGVSEDLLDQYELGKNQVSLEALWKVCGCLGVEMKRICHPRVGGDPRLNIST